MELLTKAIEAQLRKNAAIPDEEKASVKPVVKYFTPSANATWLISEIVEDGEDGDLLLFGLCDLGLGFPELGYVSLNELKDLGQHTPLRLPVERDLYIDLKYTLAEYATWANRAQHIVYEPLKEKTS
jgi:hypothetical protein